MKLALKIIVPIAIVVIGAVTVTFLIKNRPEVAPAPREIAVPLVRAHAIAPREHRFRVNTQGTVRPQQDIMLTAEVAGRVTEVSPSFNDGGFFAKGDVLVTIDPRDYELAVTRARAQLAESQVRVQREQAEADVARKEWETLGGKGEANPLLLREPQLAEARAMIASAEATLQQAELDLERCRVRAPFAGRVWEKKVDAGQYVKKGDQVARIYSVDFAEVRLPIPLDEVGYLDLPMDGRERDGSGPEVTLRARFGAEKFEWTGHIVRTEGEIDPKTRMVTAVARVPDPYGRSSKSERTPLAVGLFVEAELIGRPAGRVYIVPRAAMRGTDRLLAVDTDSKLRFRAVDVVRFESDRVVLRGGLKDGDLVCVSPLDAPVDGMQVRVLEEKP